jgi:hypothetical protein
MPILTVATGRLESVEALLRWDDPEIGSVSPAEFRRTTQPHVRQKQGVYRPERSGRTGSWVERSGAQGLGGTGYAHWEGRWSPPHSSGWVVSNHRRNRLD